MESMISAIAEAVASRLSVSQTPFTPTTVKDFASRYLESYAVVHKKSWIEDKELLARYILPPFGDRLIHEISKAELVSFHASMCATPYAANRALQLLNVMYKFAQDWGFYPELRKLPTRGIKYFQEKPRDRFLSEEELDRLGRAINSVRSAHLRALLWLYLLTGLRKTELLAVRWKDIDFKSRELTIPETKNGRKHFVPLSRPAIALFNSIPRRSEFVFPGRKPGTHLTRFERCWNRVRKAANLQDVRIHDLRRTVGSWLAQSGRPLRLIADVLNHKDMKSTLIYAHFAQFHVRDALSEHGEKISQFI